ncbi:hypothetical protein BDR26DRAFT_808625 [Obelidium mucronatum]|nr:hypothetical protein BDR26DRAFT_808625 [Obelidium mucronatum]
MSQNNNAFQKLEWEATYILFILYCFGLFATPFIATLPQMRSQQQPPPPPPPPTFTRTTRSAFLLVFASTVAHSIFGISSYGSAVLTWITLVLMVGWEVVILLGGGDSLVFECMVFIPVLVLQIINFGLCFS